MHARGEQALKVQDPNVVSVTVIGVFAEHGGYRGRLRDVRSRDRQLALMRWRTRWPPPMMPPSARTAPDTNINLYVTPVLDTARHQHQDHLQLCCRPDLLRTAGIDLTAPQVVKTTATPTLLSHLGNRLRAVTAIPTSFPQPGTLTPPSPSLWNGCRLTSTSNQHGQFSTTASSSSRSSPPPNRPAQPAPSTSLPATPVRHRLAG